MQIIVLGMHRTGTSAVSRIINMMGAYIGPEQSIGEPAFDNLKGFWERKDVKELNDWALSAVGASWDDLFDLDMANLSEEMRHTFEKRATQIIFNLDAHRPWVMKDPRLCLMFSLWRPLLEIPVCVYVHRTPLELARSLKTRDGLSINLGVALWETYNRHALCSTQGLPRILLPYRDLINEPIKTVSSLYEQLASRGVSGLRLPSEAEICAFLDDKLYHERAPLEQHEEYLNGAQQSLLCGFEDGTVLEWKQVPPLSGGARDLLIAEREVREKSTALGKGQRELSLEAKRLRIAVEGNQRDLDMLRRKRADLSSEADRLRVSLADKQRDLDMLRRKRADLSSEADRLRVSLADKQRDLVTRDQEIDQLRNEVARLKGSARSKEQQLSKLTGELRLLIHWIQQIDHSFSATLRSWRWRLGHTQVNFLEKLLRRRGVSLAVNDISNLLSQFREWVATTQPLSPTNSEPHRDSSPHPSTNVPATDQALPERLGTATYDLICFANIEWNTRYQRPQQLATQFARHGHRVFYLVASRHLSPNDSAGFRAVPVADNIYEVELMANSSIDIYSSVITAKNADLMLTSLHRLRDAFHIVDATCDVHLAFWTPVALRARNQWKWPILYDCMDEWEDFPNIGVPLLEEEKILVNAADTVAVTAALLEDKWKPHNSNCVLIRNGVDYLFFRNQYQPSALLGGMPHPIIGFYGALAAWVDLALIAFLAKSRTNWQFVLVGDVFVDDLHGLDSMANVHLLGRRPYEEMPLYLYHFEVCLIPFKLNAVTHAVDPVKFYEFMSAGKPVVSVPLEELKIYNDYLYFGEDPEDFLSQLERALTENDIELQRRRIDLARNNDWQDRYLRMDEAMRNSYDKVSIIVVTYKNVELTRLCLESILRNTTYPNYETILVDNNSPDGTANYLRYMQERHDNIQIALNNDNKGFAAANNQGLRLASGKYLVLLNNDTVVPRGWLAPLLKHADNEHIGLVGPVTNFAGNEAKIDVPYQTLEDMEMFARKQMASHQNQVFDIHVLAMFCVLMRRDVYERVGPLDESFGIGMFEDDDYSNRVRELGLRVICAEDAFVHHFGQAAFKELITSGEYHKIWDANQEYYEQKWGKWKTHEHRNEKLTIQ